MTTFANSVEKSSESAANESAVANRASDDDSLDLGNLQNFSKNDDSAELLN